MRISLRKKLIFWANLSKIHHFFKVEGPTHTLSGNRISNRVRRKYISYLGRLGFDARIWISIIIFDRESRPIMRLRRRPFQIREPLRSNMSQDKSRDIYV